MTANDGGTGLARTAPVQGAPRAGSGPIGFDGAARTEPPRFQDLPDQLPRGEELLVALDIDGTLLGHDGSLSPAVREAVEQVVRSGAHVVLSTGRSVTAVTPVWEQLGLRSGWAVCSNGAVTARMDTRLSRGFELAEVVTFDPEPPLRLLHRHLPEGLFAVEDVGAGFRVNAPFPPGELLGDVRVEDFESLCAHPAARVTLRAPDLDADDFHDLVHRTGLDGVSYAVGWTAWLDIHPEGVTKASALEQVRRHLGIRPSASVAAGDGRNDIEMLDWAGFSVAMGGADAETVAAADVTTAGVKDDGVVPLLHAIASERRSP